MMNRLLVLDRDGVINHDSDDYIKSPEEFHWIQGSLAAIARLTMAGYRIAVATNQSGLARGYFDLSTLDRIHSNLMTAVAQAGGKIEGIFYCPHGPDDGCECRKPLPGLLYRIRDTFQVPLEGNFFIGDSISDVQAAFAASMLPILVRTGKGQRTIAKHGSDLAGVPVFENLAAATDYILSLDPE